MQITLTGYADLISIHALREEGDLLLLHPVSPALDFYPRPPRGGRRNTAYQRGMADIFLSTPSARRATMFPEQPVRHEKISIHALPEEGDFSGLCAHTIRLYFYPRPPRGGRPVRRESTMIQWKFLSTPSARRATS